jgi:hypothetical protein
MILDLPDELLIAVADFVLPETKDADDDLVSSQERRGFINWADQTEKDTQAKIEKNAWIYALMQCCKRLYDLYKPLIYKQVAIRNAPYLSHLIRSLEQSDVPDGESGGLKHLIHGLDIPGYDTMLDVSRVFWLPSLQFLHLQQFDAEVPPPLSFLARTLASHERTSLVSELKLSYCSASEAALSALFSWPEKLETLYYEVEQSGDDWDCAPFVRALEPQKDCLKMLTFTRPPLVHEGLGYGPRADLHEFTKITTLRIFQVFLIDEDDDIPIAKTLPPNVEMLEVYYDDAPGYIDFLEDHQNGWVMELARYREVEGQFKHLRKLCISSGEDGLHELTDLELLETVRWHPPALWTEKYESIGVELRITLNLFRYDFDGGAEVLVWPRK